MDLLDDILKFYERLGDSPTLPPEDIVIFQVLDSRLHTIQQKSSSSSTREYMPSTEGIAELYRLAALIYLHRRIEVFQGPSPLVETAVDSAFAILSTITVCERAFPLSIVACEARTDERRELILTLIARTEEERISRSYACIKRLANLFWNQHDLDTRGSIPYSKKLDSIVALSDFLPAFT